MSPWSTFLFSPLLIPDGRISRVRLAAVAISPSNLPLRIRGLSTRLHTPLDGMVISSARHPGRVHSRPALSPAVLPLRCPLLTESLFARERALPPPGTASWHCFSRCCPTFIAPIGSCARPKSSCRLRLSLVRQVFAGCYEPLLDGGPSRRYLCDPCTGAWVRTPPRPSSAGVRCFPLGIGLPLGSRGSARGTSRNTAFRGGSFSGLQPFSHVQAPLLAWPSGCSDRQGSMSLRPPGRIHRAVPAPLPVTGSGIATCPNPDN